ncbi:MAG TPA: S8 family serine peptidase [Pyrinomonadaceae bacterium]|jgi:serine protease AprX|nr:S8 family serine peptidase [Pyrinomonadaceae bacterium]
MSERTELIDQSRTPIRLPICPVCDRYCDASLHPIDTLHVSLHPIVKSNAATPDAGHLCQRCIEIFRRAQRQIESHASIFEQNNFVLPTPLRMEADERFRGRGVTMAFLDSGFYAHPELTEPANRIVAYHSIFPDSDDPTSLETNDVASWHGMMTSVVAAGNGGLSDGFYRGIASEANLVLVKIGRTGRISEGQIQQGLEWVLANAAKFKIKVVNISAGGDQQESYLTNPLSRLVERCTAAGITVVCAVGNAGYISGHPVLPPASAPSCIAVGGLDDQNSLDRARRGMYRSSYGPTIDGLQKPEVIAPGIWVAAPILPHTPTAEEAEVYSRLDAASDEELPALLEQYRGVDKDLDEASDLRIPLLRQLITIKLREGNVINEHYKYVDGTSFAAPVVSSLIACMLEANARLSPQQIKRILIDTAERVHDVEVDRQGWGVVNAHRAIALAMELN